MWKSSSKFVVMLSGWRRKISFSSAYTVFKCIHLSITALHNIYRILSKFRSIVIIYPVSYLWHERTQPYLAHPLVSPASCTDPGVGDVEVSSVHLSTPLIAHYRQVDRLQYILMAGAWEKGSGFHGKSSGRCRSFSNITFQTCQSETGGACPFVSYLWSLPSHTFYRIFPRGWSTRLQGAGLYGRCLRGGRAYRQ